MRSSGRLLTIVTTLAGGLALAGGASGKTISVWHTEPNPRSVAVIKEIIEAFEKANPGVKVEQEAIAWGDLDAKMQAALAAGAPPDIAHGQTYVERSLSAKGLLVPIDEVIKAIGEDDIYPVVRKLDYHSGHYWGLAHAIGTDLIIYRKDFYRAAGLDPDKAPATWAEWLDQLKKLTVDTNGDGKPDRYGLDLAGPGFFINEEVYMWTGSNGGRLFQPNGRPNFTSPQVLEMLAFWKELHACCLPPEWLSHAYLDTFANLATGKVASILGWGRGTDYFEKYAPDVVAKGDIGVFPTKPVGPSGQTFLTQLDCEPWMVFKDADGAKEEIEFLKFFMRPENYRRYIQSVPIHFFPITRSMQSDPQYLATPDFAKWKFWVDAQRNVIANYEPKPLLITHWDDLQLPYLQEIAGSGILIDMVTDVVKNNRSPADAARRAQDRAEALIAQLGYKRW